MNDLTTEKMARLTAVMASAPAQAAGRLVELFERMNVKGSQVIPGSALIGALRDAGKITALSGGKENVRIPSFDRLFFEPFEKLFENGAVGDMRPGAIARSGLREAWQVILAHFVPPEFSQIKAKATEAILNGDLVSARVIAQQTRSDVLSKLKGLTPNDIAGLAKSPDAQAFLVRLAPLLLAQAAAKNYWHMIIGKDTPLHENLVGAICTQIRSLYPIDPDAACECFLMTMSLLSDPSQALKVLNKLGQPGNGPDNKPSLQEADFAIVCRRFISIASHCAAMIEQATTASALEGATAATLVKQTLQTLQGLKRQALVAPDSELCTKLLEICQIADEHLITICTRATSYLENTLPVEPIKSYAQSSMNKPRLDVPLDMGRVQLTVQHLAFVSECQALGTLWHFGTARDRASKHAAGYLNDVCEHLLRAAHINGGHPNYQAWVECMVSLIQVAQGQRAADIFEQRANGAEK
jgi:hypothetical protein